MILAEVLGVRPVFLLPALLGVFVFTLGPALVARKLLQLSTGYLRLCLCAFLGLIVGGTIVGPFFAQPGWQWSLIPVMWGVTLAATMLAMLILESFLPSGNGAVGVVKGLYGRWLRLRRYAQVSRIATRNGLPRHLSGRFNRTSPERDAAFALALRRTLEECGVTFIKLGQMLSTRRDLLPPEVIDELSKLQTEVPPAPWQEIRHKLQAELGAEPTSVFRHFEPTPLAAASIAQVHRAVLRDGREVVVKIQRPGITRVVEQDLDIVRRVSRSLHQRFGWARGIGITDLAEGFADALREELDFRIEARNLNTAGASAALHGNRHALKIPKAHGELTTARLLVMERIDGIPLGRADQALAERGTDRQEVARRLLNALLRQVMVDGVFHADPHPGNILLLPDDSLALLDFGSVGRLDRRLQGALQRLMLAIDQRDAAGLRDAFVDIMETSGSVDGEALERALGRFMARHLGPGLIPDIEMFTDLFRIVSTHGVAVPAEVAAVFRALATLEGTLAHLAPGFDIVDESRAFAEEEISAQLRPTALRQTVTDELMSLMPVLRRLPRRAERITADLEHGRLSLNIRLFADADDERAVSRLLHQAISALLAATSGVMGVVLMVSDGGPTVADSLTLYQVFGYNLLVLSLILALRVLVIGTRDRGNSR